MTARFRSGLYFKDLLSRAIRLQLIHALLYDSAILGRSVRVPKGFITDLASIPRILWNILPPIGAYDAAAVVHDWLYHSGGCSRAEADRVLLEAMRVCNVDALQRGVIYAGVRLGGWVSWNRYRGANNAAA